jgi:hypothetical protein
MRSLLSSSRLLVLPLALAFASNAQAQVGSTTDIITGRVLTPDKKPAPSVVVEVTSFETQIKRTKRTNTDGRFTVLFPDGGGQYQVVVKAVGFGSVRRNIARQGDEDRLVVEDIVLGGPQPAQLSAVNVSTGRRGQGNQRERPTAGSQEVGLRSDQVLRLPVDANDLAALAALAPGVVITGANDTSLAGISIAGQRSSATSITLDGLSMGNISVPQEALRGTRVIINTYDVTRAGFSGGQIASTTRGGTNQPLGSFTLQHRDPQLESYPGSDEILNQRYTQSQLSGSFGGPIIKDKLFYNTSGQFRRQDNPFLSLLNVKPATYRALGLSKDSIDRFTGLASGFGVPLQAAEAPDEYTNDNATGVARVDYFLADAHTVSVTALWSGTATTPGARNAIFGLPASTGANHTHTLRTQVTLTSNFESGLINELRTAYARSRQNSDPYLILPAGRTRVTSQFDDGSSGVSVLQFGGNGRASDVRDESIEINNEVSWLSPGRKHRVKLGGFASIAHTTANQTTNQWGTFTFNSLAEMEQGIATSFTRTLLPQIRRSGSVQTAAYLGDQWNPRQGLQVTYGARAEGTKLTNKPELNPEVETLFGRRTSDFPTDFRITPRAGFQWNLSRNDPNDMFSQFRPAFLIRGGFGEFRDRSPLGLFSTAASATGLTNTQAQLNCIGNAVPIPDWSSYLDDPSTIPTDCNGTSTVPTQRRTVILFDPDFATSLSRRASLGVQKRLFDRYTFSVDGMYIAGVNQTGVTDLNLVSSPQFTVPDEANRPVYVPSTEIVPSTGVSTFFSSRIHPEYGQVLSYNSGLKSLTRQVTASFNGTTSKSIQLQASYTYQRVRDQGSATGFGGVLTAGNPNLHEWATGDRERRHSFQMLTTIPVRSWMEITSVLRLASGGVFTPVVNGDINGDGSGSNDRAFIFDPESATDPTLAAGMSRLLANAPSEVRNCLRDQLGAIAARNSCSIGWYPTLDLQANFRPSGLGLKRRVVFSLIAANPLAGLDQALHGSDLHGWGQPVNPDRTLLYVRGFDPATETYRYEVNEHFGTNSAVQRAYSQPFILSLQARFLIGGDDRDRMTRFMQQQNQQNQTQQMNPIAEMIKMADTLLLTKQQIAQLQPIADSLAIKMKVIGDAIREQMAKTSAGGDMGAVFGALRPKFQEGREAMQKALDAAKAILTPEQWAKVPDRIKNPRGFGPGGGGRGGRGGMGGGGD